MHAPYVSLSLFQVVSILLIFLGHIALAYVIGVWQGRLREACEPGKQLPDDDAETLRALSRRRH